jgi:probable H4MPT-linked C1 transfer pathway protein
MADASDACIGWDIGGANLKAVRIGGEGEIRIAERAFEIWRAPAALPAALAELGHELGGAPQHAVTMTAELADCFATKRDGVRAVLRAMASAFPDAELHVFTTEGTFLSPAEAGREPLAVAGANWRASASWLAGEPDLPAGILLDVGSTTTDVVPFAGGRMLAKGRTDPERLLESELVYTGVLRTPLCAILRTAPFRGRECPVAAEHFAIAADAHLWLGHLEESDYRCPTPDSGPATRQGAAARLARTVCADLEMLAEEDVTAIARRASEAQVERIAGALGRVAKRLTAELGAAALSGSVSGSVPGPVLTAGSGAWLGEVAARQCGLVVEPLAARLGEAARVLPAYAVARLLIEGTFNSGRRRREALLSAGCGRSDRKGVRSRR